MSHEECLEKVSEYSYGIGVGKCALEMGAMGLPVLVVGRNLAGTLCDPTDYDFHIKSNTNSDISNSLGMEEDILKLKKIGQTICPTFFTFDKEEWLRLLT